MKVGSWLSVFLVILAGIAGGSCDDGDSGGQGGAPPADTFGSSACGSCVVDSCAGAVDTCGADPECSGWLGCLLDCPLNDFGDADAACEEACPVPQGLAGIEATKAITTCRRIEEGAQCEACNPAEVRSDPGSILGQQCGPSSETDACAICEDQSCCDTYAAYVASPEAQAQKECLQACWEQNGQDCPESCFAQHPDGFTAWAERSACYLTYCMAADACGGGEPQPACDVCLNDSCAAEFVELYTNPAGYLLFWCMDGLCDEACAQACRMAHPSAVPLLDTWLSCADAHCFAECAA